MSKIAKAVLIILSIVVFILAVMTLISDFISLNFDMFNGLLDKLDPNNSLKYITSGVLVIISFMGLGADSKSDDKKKCVNIQGNNGTLIITKDTFEEIAIAVVKQSDRVKNTKAIVTMKENGLSVNVFMYVLPDTNITELTSELQDKIKEKVTKITTIEVAHVNILVKGIYQENRI